ncbi:DUF2634 domain-containing protein [Paenibacillus caseinilyticus]|uniref:DUF2634 domain-containing protein n=1 Tax=Paenibacillus caseinilyticus TaxID=3098138 RepID=UPI0022B889F7|nr:DUF2634 domain-containing protein [Paenibacillus caseinilyticus]MCZ8518892.1 DUF2634 domain-containing protein [Paenibacillus caseinilyticus]
MQSLKLVNGDLVIEDGELLMVEGPEEIAQCVSISLGTNKDEWFLNPNMGIDVEKFVGKSLSMEARLEQIRQGLRQEPRIKTIDSLEIQDDPAGRTSVVRFEATAEDGTIISEEVALNVG